MNKPEALPFSEFIGHFVPDDLCELDTLERSAVRDHEKMCKAVRWLHSEHADKHEHANSGYWFKMQERHFAGKLTRAVDINQIEEVITRYEATYV